MQGMMMSFLQQMHSANSPSSHIPSLYGSSHPVPYYLPGDQYNYMPSSGGYDNSDNGN